MTTVFWPTAIQQLQQQGIGYVLATVLATKGSTPRATSSKMVITAEHSFDSIGGGNLEHKVMLFARELLQQAEQQHCVSQHIEHFPLAASLGQCCGGYVSVLIEVFPETRPHVALFGAGHVGKALTTILAELPVRVTWLDERKQQFPEQRYSNVMMQWVDDWQACINTLNDQSYCYIMTHDHTLDYKLAEYLLLKQTMAYIGVIGSTHKAKKLQQRLRHKEIADSLITQVHCPIGLTEVSGKHPMEVAVSISAEIIQHYQQQAQASIGLSFREQHSLTLR